MPTAQTESQTISNQLDGFSFKKHLLTPGNGRHDTNGYHNSTRSNFNPNYSLSPFSIGIECEKESTIHDLRFDPIHRDTGWCLERDLNKVAA